MTARFLIANNCILLYVSWSEEYDRYYTIGSQDCRIRTSVWEQVRKSKASLDSKINCHAGILLRDLYATDRENVNIEAKGSRGMHLTLSTRLEIAKLIEAIVCVYIF